MLLLGHLSKRADLGAWGVDKLDVSSATNEPLGSLTPNLLPGTGGRPESSLFISVHFSVIWGSGMVEMGAGWGGEGAFQWLSWAWPESRF